MDTMTVDYALVTHGPEGINRVAAMLPPPAEGVRYVVSWQNHADAPVPAQLLRPDVKVVRTYGIGVSGNRNNAAAHCDADIMIIADDDLVLYPEAPDIVRRAYRTYPECDFITFRSDHGDMSRFPTESIPLGRKLPKGYYIPTFEITMRRATAKRVICCPELGVGTEKIQGGEDDLLLWTAVRSGFNCRFVPETICAHPGESTGIKARMTPGNIRAAGCVIALMYPLTALPRLPVKAWRLWRGGKNSLSVIIRNILLGVLDAPGVYRRNRDIFNARPRALRGLSSTGRK